MQVRFWGTRGSIAKPGPGTVRFGGNTSCVEVRSNAGTLVLLDCGTGAHEFGQILSRIPDARVDGHILLSHTHWDHIQGLPFFAPLFRPGNVWHLYGPRGLDASIAQTLAGQMQYTYFPVSLEDFGATVDYHDLVEGILEIGDIRVTAQYLNHPALTLGYRLDADGATVVYSSDHEPHEHDFGAAPHLVGRDDARHIEFLRDADLVIHDAQYLSEEYPAKRGWGHSPVEYAVDIAHAANVRHLALFHHDPTRDDDAVDALLRRARSYATAQGYRGEVFAAAEGQLVTINSDDGPARVRRDHTTMATQAPAIDTAADTVLLAAHNPAIVTTMRAAARAEGLEPLEATDREGVLDIASAQEPPIIIIEAEPDGSVAELVRAVRDIHGPYGDDVRIVIVTTQKPRDDDSAFAGVTDWLVWPSTLAHFRTKLRTWLLRRACRWQSAPLPDDEPQRIESLHRLAILDTEPEARFDRYTELACSTFDVPIALVSLVDTERQWFKSRRGIDATEAPRDTAICAHAILGDDVLQIPDAFDDARFAENPLVVGSPRVRFYAGVPLTLADGSRVGTFCVLDHRPRVLDDAQLDRLRAFGKLVETELEPRRPPEATRPS